MKSNYPNKMQQPERNKRFTNSSEESAKKRYREYRIATLQIGAKPMEWRDWLKKEGC